MAFAPVIPLSGVAGWLLLTRVEDTQRATFEKSPDIEREAAYFAENVGEATTAADLVADRRLLNVALTAFGLETEIDKRAFIRKALESDTLDPQSFAVKLVDESYEKMARAFGYGDVTGVRVNDPGFAGTIIAAYRERSFETAVGESDSSLRLALNARRELAVYAEKAQAAKSPASVWFSAMGDLPMREVFQTAYGLPSSFSQIDIDRQREVLQDKTRELFGDASLDVFADPDNVEKLIRRYLARDAANQGASAASSGAAALSLLQQAGASFANLVQSRF